MVQRKWKEPQDHEKSGMGNRFCTAEANHRHTNVARHETVAGLGHFEICPSDRNSRKTIWRISELGKGASNGWDDLRRYQALPASCRGARRQV